MNLHNIGQYGHGNKEYGFWIMPELDVSMSIAWFGLLTICIKLTIGSANTYHIYALC